MYAPLDRGLGVDLLLVLCWEDVDSVLSPTLAEQLSSSTCLIHLCIKTQKHKQEPLFSFLHLFRLNQIFIVTCFSKQAFQTEKGESGHPCWRQ